MLKYIRDKISNRIVKTKILPELTWNCDYGGNIKRIYGDRFTNEITMSNSRCHQNSFDLYKKDNRFKPKCCLCVNPKSNYAFIHFVNYDESSDTWIDNTLGTSIFRYTVYVFHCEWLDIELGKTNPDPNNWLGWAKEDLYNRFVTNPIYKLFLERGETY